MADHHRRAEKERVQEVLLDDPDFLKELVQRVLQQVLETQMTEHVGGAAPYERTENRKGHRNGYKERTLKTRVGKLELLVPQDREGTFSTRLFARYQRNEKALVLAYNGDVRRRGLDQEGHRGNGGIMRDFLLQEPRLAPTSR
jgi:transposase-like protein